MLFFFFEKSNATYLSLIVQKAGLRFIGSISLQDVIEKRYTCYSRLLEKHIQICLALADETSSSVLNFIWWSRPQQRILVSCLLKLYFSRVFSYLMQIFSKLKPVYTIFWHCNKLSWPGLLLGSAGWRSLLHRLDQFFFVSSFLICWKYCLQSFDIQFPWPA